MAPLAALLAALQLVLAILLAPPSSQPFHVPPLAARLPAERALYFRTPLDFLFWFSCLSSVCALFGLAGIFSSQPALVTIFFGYNLVQQILAFSLFVDVLADQKIRYVGEAAAVTPYEQVGNGCFAQR